MDVNSCRICLLSDLCEMKSIFDVVSSQDYAEKITFISGIYVNSQNKINFVLNLNSFNCRLIQRNHNCLKEYALIASIKLNLLLSSRTNV